MRVIFKKLDDRYWRLSRADNEDAYRVSSRHLAQIVSQLKVNYNIDVYAADFKEDKMKYYAIIAQFDNDSDEAEFVMKASNGITLDLTSLLPLVESI
jgi:hypothetical protein